MPPRTPVLDLARPAVHALCRAWFGLSLRGTDHIPADGPVIITPNHQTYADPPLVTIPIRRPVHYMAWDRLFAIPLFGRFIRVLRAFPVDVDGRDARAMREAMRLLRRQAALMIFPEGERSRDGSVGRFHLGAFRLAVSAGAPVLPVTIDGGHACWPPGQALPRPGRVTITYHPL
ncbi:MAG TPA: lysophospholipid acyltransferase family protein, partial [Candidatus Tectomicrobia bacterium]|nr:lysophospholipid acyltransferase family protein [Candidatus Tectomicrobia bacterium]